MSEELNLDSAMQCQIPNEQTHEISYFEQSQFSQLDTAFSIVAVRSEPTARYNCHGLTFAGRRTAIHKSTAVQQALHEDGYVAIDPSEVLPGDIIMYYEDGGDIEHSGIVLKQPREEFLRIPLVVSKWGKHRELIHWANQSPYSFANVKYFRINVSQA